MPTYQYVCTDCGSDLEAVQSFSDPSLTECPTCGGKLRKRFGAVGVVFKGSGFYRTDSRSDARTAPGERKSESGEKGEKSDKSDKAPAATKADGKGDGAKSDSSSAKSSGSSNGSATPSSGGSSTPAATSAA